MKKINTDKLTKQCNVCGSAGWLMRVYYKLEPEDERGRAELCAAHCSFPHLDLCDVTDLPQPWGDLQASQQVRESCFVYEYVDFVFGDLGAMRFIKKLGAPCSSRLSIWKFRYTEYLSKIRCTEQRSTKHFEF